MSIKKRHIEQELDISINKKSEDHESKPFLSPASKLNKFPSFAEVWNFKFLVVFFSLVFSFLLYSITLRGCSTDGEMACVVEVVPMIPTYGLFVVVVVLIIDGVIFLSMKKIIPKSCLYLAILEIFVIGLISNGNSFQNHGSYNRLVFFILLILNFLTIYIFGIIYAIFRKHPKIFSSVIVIVGVLLYFVIVVIWFGRNCENWEKGMKNSITSKENCVLPQPKSCFYDLTNNWFDLSRILNKNDCSKVQSLVPVLNEPADFVAYPKTQYFLRSEKNFEVYQLNIMAQMKKVTEDQIHKEAYEVVLDQRNNDKKILINVFPNQTFIERSKNILNNPNTTKPLARNILMVFIDSVSRQHFPRKMQKTYKWMENYYRNKTSPLETFQFFKYHTSAPHTVPNMMKIFYGAPYENASTSYPLSQKFKNLGYITGKSNNYCGSTFFDVSDRETELYDLNMESYDHENTALFCDPNYQKMGEDGQYGYMEGSFAMVRRCLYGKDTHTHVLDYGNKFWRTYKDHPKFLEVGFMDGHEPSNELLQHLDEPFANFLIDLEEENLLNDTAIVFYADHGHHVNIFYHLFQLNDLQYELRLPMIFLILPRDLADKYGDGVRSYEQNLVAAYDIYNTFSFLGGSKDLHPEGLNFLEKNDKPRCYNKGTSVNRIFFGFVF